MTPTTSAPAAAAAATADADLLRQSWAALEDVRDPELDVSLVGLGLIQGLEVQRGRAHVRITFTSMGCPWTDLIRDDVRRALLAVPGIREVRVEDVWGRPWTARDLRADARARLREIGVVPE